MKSQTTRKVQGDKEYRITDFGTENVNRGVFICFVLTVGKKFNCRRSSALFVALDLMTTEKSDFANNKGEDLSALWSQ